MLSTHDSTTCQTNMHKIIYHVQIVNRDSNGGVAGQAVKIIEKHPIKSVTIKGIDCHQLNNIPICTVGGVVSTHVGEVILVLLHYAYTGRGATIHSPGQFEYYGSKVHNQLRVTGGKQCIETINGLYISLDIDYRLPCLSICPFTYHKWEMLPTVFMADDSKDWDPQVLDYTLTGDQQWAELLRPPQNPYHDYNNTGAYFHWSVYMSKCLWNLWKDNDQTPDDADENKHIVIFEDENPLPAPFIDNFHCNDNGFDEQVDDILWYANHVCIANNAKTTGNVVYSCFMADITPEQITLVTTHSSRKVTDPPTPCPVTPDPFVNDNVPSNGAVVTPPLPLLPPQPPPDLDNIPTETQHIVSKGRKSWPFTSRSSLKRTRGFCNVVSVLVNKPCTQGRF